MVVREVRPKVVTKNPNRGKMMMFLVSRAENIASSNLGILVATIDWVRDSAAHLVEYMYHFDPSARAYIQFH